MLVMFILLKNSTNYTKSIYKRNTKVICCSPHLKRWLTQGTKALRNFSYKDDVNVILLLGVSIMCICLWILLFANVDTNNVQLLVHPLFAFSTAHIWLFLERKHDITGLFFICCCISYVDISRTKDIIYIWKE